MRDDASTHHGSNSRIAHLTDGLASLPGTVVSSLAAATGADDCTESVCRRKFLMAAGAAGTAALAGCPGTVSRTFSAQPVVLPDSAQAERNYAESTVDAITTERSGSVAGVDFEATIENHLAAYRPSDPPDEGADGELYPDIGSLASPAAAIQGSSINPLTSAPLQSIVAGEVLPQVRAQMLSRLSGLEGSDLAWLRGPTPINEQTILPDRQEETSLTGRFLDDDVEIVTFGGVARDAENRYAVLILIARRVADDVAIAAGVLDTPLAEQSTDRPIVDANNGYFTPEHLSGGLSIFLDLLPRFRVEGSDEPDTPTVTPIQTPTPGTATSPASSGSGLVIDDFEDGDTKEYSTTGVANSSLVASPTKNGSTALEFTNMYASGPVHGLESGSGLPNYPHLGDRFRVWFRFGSTPNPDQLFQLEFGQDDDGNEHMVEAAKLGRRPDSTNEWWVSVYGNGSPRANNAKVQLSKGTWYAFDVAWGPTEIRLSVLDSSGAVLGRTAVPSTGDNGDDYIAFKGFTEANDFQWDYAHILGGARDGYPRIIDDFEDGTTTEYRTTGLVNTAAVRTPTKNGSQALEFTNTTGYGIASPGGSAGSLPHYPHQGDRFRAWFRFEGSSSSTIGCSLEFGQDGSQYNNLQEVYAERLSGTWRAGIQSTGGGSNSFTPTLSMGTWYAFDVAWKPHEIRLELVDATGSSLGSATIPGEGDSGDDHLKLKADVGRQDKVIWDYIHIRDHAR